MYMKNVIIAEKPSVAQSIAAIVGAGQRRDGYIEGNGYAVTWAFGHLVQLAMPEAYGFAGFRRENLPILPAGFTLIPRQKREGKEYKDDPGVVHQLNIIKGLFEGGDRIIVATDAGREGELIFRYIYHYLGCTKPFVRLWISSLTDKAIREGMERLQPGGNYDNLYLSAKARSEADWLIGINGSQALSLAAGRGVFSLGRVQTPTLAMICSRYLENRSFTPKKYMQIRITVEKDGIAFHATAEHRYENKTAADNALGEMKACGTFHITELTRREVKEEPPLLYDLTALQREANTRLDFSADRTLSLAQSLYEKKVLSYPRTGSRYVSEDVFDEIPSRIALLRQHPRFGQYAASLSGTPLNRRSVDGGKVTDHHALIITENLPSGLSKDEQAIYDMVAARLLEAFSAPCIKEVTEIHAAVGNDTAQAKGTVVKSAGWRAVRGEKEDGDEDAPLPRLEQDESLPIQSLEAVERQTKPKPLHTENSLLSAIEHCGREIGDEQLRASIRETGIGTPATRAAVIETLFARGYIRREKKSLVPTDKGMAVHETVKDKKIANVEMTAAWEDTLARIESGEADAAAFRRDIEAYTAQIVTELLESKVSVASPKGEYPCPKCRNSRVLFFPKVVKCADVDCGFTLFRNKGGKELSDKQLAELLTKGRTGVIKGFKSKEGKAFDASLVLRPDFSVGYEFADKKPSKGKSAKKK